MTQSEELELAVDIGADWSMAVELEGIAITAEGPVELVVEDADGAELAVASIANGRVTVQTISPDAAFSIALPRAVTATFPARRHRYALWVTDAADKRQVYLHGAIVANRLPEASA